MERLRDYLVASVGYYRVCEGYGLPRAVAAALRDEAVGQARRLACRVLGHRIVDDGYGGPDSGCVELRCERCGWSAGRITLY